MQSKTLYIGAILEREILSPFFYFIQKRKLIYVALPLTAADTLQLRARSFL